LKQLCFWWFLFILLNGSNIVYDTHVANHFILVTEAWCEKTDKNAMSIKNALKSYVWRWYSLCNRPNNIIWWKRKWNCINEGFLCFWFLFLLISPLHFRNTEEICPFSSTCTFKINVDYLNVKI
jgi:hypothetical protein